LRVVALVAYDGTEFFGSQPQKSGQKTVLGAFEKALRSVGIFGAPVASGRTDSGVHALRAPIAFDTPLFWGDRLGVLRESLNKKLYPHIKIKSIFPVRDEFHPRFDAKKRLYRYVIKEGEYDPFLASYITFVPSINKELINEAIKIFEGRHDFAFFRKAGSDEKSTVRTMFRAAAYEHRGFFILSFAADGFLRSQIRLMAGALLELSNGEVTKEELKEQLKLKSRYANKPAPPNGLYLSRVYY